MTSYSSGIGSPLARLGVTLIALCAGAAAQGQSLQIAVSNSSNQTPNSYFNASDSPITTAQNSNIIYGVTAMPQTGAPPALTLSVLPINPVYTPSTPAVYGGFNSITYAPSTQPGATVDLIAAQPYYASGAIWRFFGPTFSGTTSPPGPTDAVQVWSCGDSCNGPQSPIAMAVDASGTLYVLSNDYVGCGESTAVELWAFAKLASNASGFAGSPVLIDPMVAGYGGTGCTQRDYSGNNISISSGEPSEYPNPYYVRDLMIAPPGMMSVNSPVGANDVLVLFGDYSDSATLEGTPVALIADYNASNLAAVLGGGTLVAPQTIANSSDIIDWGEAIVEGVWTSLESGDGALSFAAWPADSTMLVMTQLGNVFKFTWSSTTSEEVTTYKVVNQPVFATGLPSYALQNAPAQEESGEGYLYYLYFQVGNLRTGVEAGKSYAFATAYTLNEDGPTYGPTYPSEMVSMDGIHTPAASAMQSDGPMSSLAVSNSGTGTGAECVTGCNLTGGVQQVIMGTPAAIAAVEALGSAGTIVENVCIVEQDPRHICNKNAPPAPGNPLYNSKTLPVTAVCPNSNFNPSFGSTVIPDYICGNYGSGGAGTGTGFVLIQGIANGVDAIPGLLVYSDANPDYFFGTGLSEPCTLAESDTLIGWAPWSVSPVEGTIPEGRNMIELTYGCGTSRGTSSGMSLSLVGGILSLNTASEFKPNYVSFAQFKFNNLLLDVLEAPIDLPQKVRLLEIVAKSDLFLAEGKYQCAVRKVWRADKYVSDHASHFHGVPGTDPNSYGRSRSRLANLFLTIFSRVEGNPAPQMWPLPTPPGVCPGNLDIDPDGY